MPPSNLDHAQLARELIRTLRGDRSQVQLSRRLGYRTNVAYSWESGRRYPTASGFFTLLRRTGVDLPATLAPFYRRRPAWLDEEPASERWVQAFLEDLRGHTTLQQLAAHTGISRHALSRWCRGRAQPRLPELLRFIDGTSDRLLRFLERFVDPATLPSVRERWEHHQRAHALAWADPWSQVVLLALELPSYRATPEHSDRWLAATLGLDVSVVTSCVSRLSETGQIVRRRAHYQPAEVLSINLRGPRTGASLKQHWAQVAAERVDTEQAMVSYNLFTISDEDLQTLREMQRAHYRAVRALVAASKRPERLILLNLQTVPLDRPPPGH